MTTVREIQDHLIANGHKIKADGKWGQETRDAIGAEFGIKKSAAPASTLFDAASAKRLAGAHPDIQRVMNAARVKVAFTILDSQRGRAAQELAFKQGHSKAHFGQSAHNWSPAIAVDIAPSPLNWGDTKSFIALSKVIMPIAKELGVPLRWGGDWNMDGSTSDGWDFPHYELHPWREYAKNAKPFAG